MGINIFVVLRLLIGCVFIISGFEKLIGPYQNFLYVVQGYELFGPFLENVSARLVPWIELFLGVFLVLGFWLKWVLRVTLALTVVFIVVVAQAVVRNLAVLECGCFGDFISVPLPVLLVFDSILLIVIGSLIKNKDRTGVFGLDRYFKDEG